VLGAERQSKNSIQNDAADIMRVVMIALEEDKRLKELDVVMLLQIHDELLFEAPDDEQVIEEAKKIIKYHMENAFNERAFKLKVPLKAKPQSGIDWSSIH
jgi:DNA polymerase-1